MRLLRLKSLLLMAFVLFSAQAVLAAGSTPYFNWTGPYVGLHIGYGWGLNDGSLNSPAKSIQPRTRPLCGEIRAIRSVS